jgi:hypothetical protein
MARRRRFEDEFDKVVFKCAAMGADLRALDFCH